MTKINCLSLLVILSASFAILSSISLTKITSPLPSSTAFPKITPINPPERKILLNEYHVFQTFNNCGPAALSMALSYYKIKESQQVLGLKLRPYQNPHGDNDDKSVTLDELGEKAKDYGLTPYHRPNGNVRVLKLFIAYDIPIIARTLTKATEDIGHYRIVKGFDNSTSQIIQDDSLQGKNLRYSYDNFNALWKAYNYEYLVLVPPDKKLIAEAILGEDKDLKTAWQKAVENSRVELIKNPDDTYARFNLSVALYNTGDFRNSVEEFEKVENSLPFRTLWYQIEPILAYYELGDYKKVFEITDKILRNYNLAYSELYLIRGEIYKKHGNLLAARKEFENAHLYNVNLKKAREAIESL